MLLDQILLDHLKLPTAYQMAKRYVHCVTPYTSTMYALEQRYGQPCQLIQGELKAILSMPPVRLGDPIGFKEFSSAVNTLVGMLINMEGAAQAELMCGSHVDKLLSKLPATYSNGFVEYCLNRGIIHSGSDL